MVDGFAGVLIAVFLALAALHLYWALGGRALKLGAVPQVAGRPAFVPSPVMTLAVALALSICALLVAGTVGWLPIPIPQGFFCALLVALALVFLARAIGDFRLVGFFKKVHDSPFAYLDTRVFSPLCLAIALGLLLVAVARY
ncbi:MAG: DUF3995 domain-containing protein [Pseudomonadota bacterium]